MYYWIIAVDNVSDGKDLGEAGGDPRAMASETSSRFEMFDDDGEHYYSGRIWGDFQGFEPMDDFGGPNAGCTMIKIDGKIL